jgi:hypothetical protein
MATLIEKNTKKLVEHKLNMLFAKQQQLNNNAGGQQKMEGGGTSRINGRPGTYNSQGIPLELPNVGVTGYRNRFPQYTGMGIDFMRNNYNSNINPALLGNVNITGTNNRTADPNAQNIHSAGEAQVVGKQPSPSDFWDNTGLNPYNFYNNKQASSSAPVNMATDPRFGTNFSNVPEATSNAKLLKQPSDPSLIPNAPGIQDLGFDPAMNMATDPQFGSFEQSLEAYSPAVPSLSSLNNTSPNSKLGTNGLAKAPTPGGSSGPNWGKVGTFAAQMAPMLYNLGKGLQKPDKVKPNYNPYESKVRSLMANRRFNIDPLLNANLNAQAVSNRNIRNTANSRGELMGNLGAAQNYRMAGDAAAWSQKNNMDNQYMAEQAQMDANLGGNRAQMDWNTQTANAQNKAATNQFLGQSMNDFSKFSQMQQLMGNQKNRDAQLASLYPDMYSQIYQFQPAMQAIIKAAGNMKGI